MDDEIIKKYAQEHPRRDVAVVGLRDSNGDVLLMRAHKLPHLWQPVGGGIDPHDYSPQAAALRELREEMGVRLDPSVLVEVLTTPYDFGEGTVFFFEAEVDRDTLNLSADTDEVVEYRWFSPREAASLPAMPATAAYLRHLLP